MGKKFLISFILFFIVIFFSIAAKASIRLVPGTLVCPESKEGEEVDCGTLTLRNSNLILGIKVNSVRIGDTTNFTLDTSNCSGKTIGAGSSCSMNVTFHPQSGGGFYTTAEATYTYLGFIKKNTRAAWVYGLAVYPIVRLSTHEIDFGHQTIDTRHRQYVKMENIGNDTLNISSISTPLGSSFSSENDCGDSLAAGNYCGILVYFEPTVAGEYVSTLDIVDDAYDSPQQVNLSGTGIDPGSPDINIEKTHVNYGDVLLNTESSETITITSTGTVDLNIASIVISGSPYTQTNDCPATLAPSETCTITAKFSPTIAGAYDGTITITDDATDSPQTIYLSGKGVSPNATLIPGLIDFGNQTINKSSVEQEVILLNSGTSTLTIYDISTSSSIYTQTNTCSDTLEAKQECRIWIVFSPVETGQSSDTLTVTTDDASSPAEVYLFGNGITGPDLDISPPLHDFGSVDVGTISKQQNFTITNTGEGDLEISSITVNSDFEQTNECPDTLIEEQSCDVETVFVPQVAGNYFGVLSIVDNAEGSPHKANLMGYGVSSAITIMPASVNFGEQTINRSSLAQEVRLINSGNEAITIDSIDLSSDVFAQTNDCGSTLAPSNYCTISAVFTPLTAEYLTAEIVITDSVTGSPHRVHLAGTGIDPVYPDLDISPNSWDFGQVLVGNTSTAKEFTVKNTGVVDVTISGIDANSEFAQTNNCPETLASDATCTITGTFSPEASGKFTGYIKVIDNTYKRYQTVSLSGIGTHTGDIDLSYSTNSLDFGNVTVYKTSNVKSVILTNSGTNDLTIGEISIQGDEASDFSMSTNCGSRILDVGKSCIIDATFNPIITGLKTASIMVYDDAHDSPQSITLSGTGADASGCSLTKEGSNKTTLFFVTMFILFSFALRRVAKRKL